MSRTAGEAGWHKSRYNIGTPLPDSNTYIMVNLFKGTCAGYTPVEMFLYDRVETLDEHHPILERFAQRGVIVNFDETEMLSVMGRLESSSIGSDTFHLTLCPTTGCNFDCPYCFERHNTGLMTPQVQDDVVRLVEKLLDAYHYKKLDVSWYGGEPLLGPRIIEALSGRLIALCEARGAEYTAGVITNGYLLDGPMADLLDRCRVTSAQITLDGVGAMHDQTRHLVGGGPTFARIIDNLRSRKLPFEVNIRHNVHAGNYDQIEPLRKLIKEIAAESGNRITYAATPVGGSEEADHRGSEVQLLNERISSELGIRKDTWRFTGGRGAYCFASRLDCMGIDEKGNLHRCWENVDKTEQAFGNAADWDPKDIFRTSSNPDNLTRYLNVAMPMEDPECRNCVWLPACAGGCPNNRIFYHKKACLPYRDHPEEFALALYRRYEALKAGDPDASFWKKNQISCMP